MPATLTNTISKIQLVPNSTNASLITDFHKYMVSNGASQRHQTNTLKMVIEFVKYLGPNCTFYDLEEMKMRVIRLMNEIAQSALRQTIDPTMAMVYELAKKENI
jgi:hypothetical protein